jgi:lysozyme
MSEQILTAAARFVAKWEGFLPNAYLDEIAVPAVYTIAYGHTGLLHGRALRAGDRVTEAEGRGILAHDLRGAARTVAEKVKVPLTRRQRIALISIVFNCGPGVLENTHLIHAINAKRYREAADRFLEWDHAGGVVVQGLLNRRRAERWMFLHSRHPRNPHKPKPHRKAALPT